MLTEISDFFNVQMESLPYDDWDQVEEKIKKVVKSSRAGSNFQATNARANGPANEKSDVKM